MSVSDFPTPKIVVSLSVSVYPTPRNVGVGGKTISVILRHEDCPKEKVHLLVLSPEPEVYYESS